MSKLMLRGGLSTNKGKGEISMEDKLLEVISTSPATIYRSLIQIKTLSLKIFS